MTVTSEQVAHSELVGGGVTALHSHAGGGAAGANIKTGTYTGNAVDNRDIDIGVGLSSKEFPYVIIKRAGAHQPVHRIEYGQGDVGMVYTATADFANTIQAFTATGFQVGTDNSVNGSGYLYRYIAIWKEP